MTDDWPPLPDVLPVHPCDDDGYCVWCGNGRWKEHAPWCSWADVVEAFVSLWWRWT